MNIRLLLCPGTGTLLSHNILLTITFNRTRNFSSFPRISCYRCEVGLTATARRRWLGALVLLAALAMLVAGETVLKNQLTEPGTFLVYWLVCFGLTGSAILIAFLDVRALHARTREEQRDLVHRTLREIETDARGKDRPLDK